MKKQSKAKKQTKMTWRTKWEEAEEKMKKRAKVKRTRPSPAVKDQFTKSFSSESLTSATSVIDLRPDVRNDPHWKVENDVFRQNLFKIYGLG
jgi:hypothetical protein